MISVDPPPSPPPVLTRPKSCLGCGYDLTGLPDARVCPECAGDIAELTKTQLLRIMYLSRRGAIFGMLFIPCWLPTELCLWISKRIFGDDWGALGIAMMADTALQCFSAIGTALAVLWITTVCSLKSPGRRETMGRRLPIAFAVVTVASRAGWWFHIPESFGQRLWLDVGLDMWWGFQVTTIVYFASIARDYIESRAVSNRPFAIALGLAVFRLILWICGHLGLWAYLRDVPELVFVPTGLIIRAVPILIGVTGIAASVQLYRCTNGVICQNAIRSPSQAG